MHYKDKKDIKRTDQWLASNGIGVNQIYIGSTELFQAQMLATKTLKQYANLLEHDQASTLNNFLRAANGKHRSKISQGSCYRVMNITKQVKRKHAKLTKQLSKANIKANSE